MLKRSACGLITLAFLGACATPVPVAVTCPPPPPAPQILTEPASAESSLSEQYNSLMDEFRDSLHKAMTPE